MDYGAQLKYFGMQLQNIGTQVQNIAIQMSLMNCIGMQLKNMGENVSNIGLQIFNMGLNISNNLNNAFQINNNLCGVIPKIDIINQMNYPLYNQNNNLINNENKEKYITIKFWNTTSNEIINITTTVDKTIEELLQLYIQKKGLNAECLKKISFIFNGITINQNEKKTILNYGLMHQAKIAIYENQNLIGGP